MVQCCQLRQHWSAPGGAYSVSALEVQHFAANGDDFTVRIHLHLKLKTWSIESIESIESMESIQFNLDHVILCHIFLAISQSLVDLSSRTADPSASTRSSYCIHAPLTTPQVSRRPFFNSQPGSSATTISTDLKRWESATRRTGQDG